MLPKLIFDTNVPSRLVEPQYANRLNKFVARLSRRFTLCISPNTYLELLNGIKGGDGRFFAKDQAKFRLMAGGGSPRFLPFSIEFALATTLKIPPVTPGLSTRYFEESLRGLMRANSRDQLFTGRVRRGASSRSEFGIDPDAIAEPMKKGEANHIESFKQLKDGNLQFPPPEKLAHDLGAEVGCNLTEEQARQLADGLDAAYRYDLELYRLAKNGYNIEGNPNDWIDSHQLFYLCDSQVTIATGDTRMRSRCSNSPQSQRIITLDELMAKLSV